MGNRNAVVQALLSLAATVLLLITACAKPQLAAPPAVPLLPAGYYKCTQVEPLYLLNAYFSNYNAVSQVEAQYNDQVYVFKNIELTAKQIENLKQGYIWVEMVKCAVSNSGDAAGFKAGDKVDVVGFNKGLSMEFRGLVFTNSYVLAANAVQLPAEGQGGNVIGGY
jgi:hypothetical protein